MLLRLLAALDPKRFSHHVVCMAGPGEIGSRIAGRGVPVHYLGIPRGRFSVAGVLQWIRLLRRIRPTILQSWMYHANLLALSAPLIVAGIRVFWNVQASGRDPVQFKTLTRGVIRATCFLSGFPEAVIINSEKGRADHLRMGYRCRNLHRIPNGFDLAAYVPVEPGRRREIRKAFGMETDAFCVGMFARYHPVKDHETALKAAGRIRKDGLEPHFYFAGEGVAHGNTRLQSLMDALGLTDSVHLMGYRKEVPSLMAAMDVVISCSRSEGLSNVIGEAMACGGPCVVTDVGDSARVVGDTGKIVRPGDHEALATAVIEMIRMLPEERRRMGERARARIRRWYAIQAIADAYAGLYAKGGGCRPPVEEIG